MFTLNRDRAPVAETPSIPVLSQEEVKQVSGAGFLLTEQSARPLGFWLTEQSVRPMGFLLTE